MSLPERLVLASGNAGKLREVRRVLGDAGVEVLSQKDFTSDEAEETGLSFVENAILKARFLAGKTGLAVLADDSGLAVDALGGAPGIYSSRYAGEDASDRDNLQKLLHEMKNIPEQDRQARFVCVMVLLKSANDPLPLIFQGEWPGHITLESFGEGGFGYDPVFRPTGMSVTAAELDPVEKNRVSHRGQALAALLDAFG